MKTKNMKAKLKTIIGENTKINGDIVGEGGILVNGEITGSIKTKGFISIGENGVVNASVECAECVISGKIEGNIIATKSIQMNVKSIINGDIIAPKLKMEEGAILNGKCLMDKSKKATSKNNATK